MRSRASRSAPTTQRRRASTPSAYLTPKGSIAVVVNGRNAEEELLDVYHSYKDFVRHDYPWALVADVADLLGEEPPIEELDI